MLRRLYDIFVDKDSPPEGHLPHGMDLVWVIQDY